MTLQNVTPGIARSFAIDPANPAGALVDDVVRDSPAARAGLRQGDVILAVNGTPVRIAHDLPRLACETPIGGRITLTLRRDGKDHNLAARVGAMPEQPKIAAADEAGSGSSQPPSGALGMELQPLTPDLRRRLQLPKSVDGVFVAELAPTSPAASLGVNPGDVIVSVDRQKVTSPLWDLDERLRGAIADGNVLMLVNRHGTPQFVGAALDDRRANAEP